MTTQRDKLYAAINEGLARTHPESEFCRACFGKVTLSEEGVVVEGRLAGLDNLSRECSRKRKNCLAVALLGGTA